MPEPTPQPQPQTLAELLAPGAHVRMWLREIPAGEIFDRSMTGTLLDVQPHGVLFRREDTPRHVTAFISWATIGVIGALDS